MVKKYWEVIEEAIPLLESKQYSCDCIMKATTPKENAFNDLFGKEIVQYLWIEFGLGLECGMHAFAEFEKPTTPANFTNPTPESQQARALWLTFASHICKERDI